MKNPAISTFLLADGGASMTLPGTSENLDLALLCDIPLCFKLAVKVCAAAAKRETDFGELEEHIVKVQVAEALEECSAPQERDAWAAAFGSDVPPDSSGALTSRTGR